MTLDAHQVCQFCGRDFSGEGDADLQPGCACLSDDCPSDCLGQYDGKVGLICEDVTDGSFVRLEAPREPWVWECSIWCGNHWSHEGDRIHLSDLRRIANSIPEMIGGAA